MDHPTDYMRISSQNNLHCWWWYQLRIEMMLLHCIQEVSGSSWFNNEFGIGVQSSELRIRAQNIPGILY